MNEQYLLCTKETYQRLSEHTKENTVGNNMLFAKTINVYEVPQANNSFICLHFVEWIEKKKNKRRRENGIEMNEFETWRQNAAKFCWLSILSIPLCARILESHKANWFNVWRNIVIKMTRAELKMFVWIVRCTPIAFYVEYL